LPIGKSNGVDKQTNVNLKAGFRMTKPQSIAEGKSPQSTSQSESESEKEDEEARKAAFESFGQQFLAQFDPLPSTKKRKRTNEDHLENQKTAKKRKSSPDDDEAEEWGGIRSSANVEVSLDSGSEDEVNDDGIRCLYLIVLLPNACW
jgi:hypothetical protein